MAATPGNHRPNIRAGVLQDLPAIADVLARAFYDDPAMNWYGCVTKRVAHYNPTDPGDVRTLRRLRDFQLCVVAGVFALDGIVSVATVPREDKHKSEDDSMGERIVAVAIWLKPGQKLDIPLRTLIKLKPWAVLRGWGLKGFKRLLFDFTPTVEQALENGFRSRGLDRLDSWHLLEVVVDPEFQGRGCCSLLVKEGFTRTAPKPVHLEASTAKSRDIYIRYGFEIDEEHTFGKGAVDAMGIAAQKKDATGYPEWVMTKWTY